MITSKASNFLWQNSWLNLTKKLWIMLEIKENDNKILERQAIIKQVNKLAIKAPIANFAKSD